MLQIVEPKALSKSQVCPWAPWLPRGYLHGRRAN